MFIVAQLQTFLRPLSDLIGRFQNVVYLLAGLLGFVHLMFVIFGRYMEFCV